MIKILGAADSTTSERFVLQLLEELERARAKFPSANLSMVALMEEVGELAQAKLKWRANKGSYNEVWKEAIQVGVMAMRVAIEPDDSFNVDYVEPEKVITGKEVCDQCAAPLNWAHRIEQMRKDHT